MDEYTQNQYYFKDVPVEDIFHIYSDGNTAGELFISRNDFKKVMNLIPRCAMPAGITIYAFTIVNSHIHLIAKGSLERCRKFCVMMARGISRRLHGSVSSSDIVFSADRIRTERETMSKICYVLLNTLDAEQSLLPFYYEWSTNFLYFRGGNDFMDIGAPLSSYTEREKRRMLNADYSFPAEWRVVDDVIHPSNYVDYQYVNGLFGSAGRFLAFYHQPKKDRMRLTMELGHNHVVRRNDSEMKHEADMLARHLFGRCLKQLEKPERITLAKEMLIRYYSSPKQLGRVLDVDADILGAIRSST